METQLKFSSNGKRYIVYVNGSFLYLRYNIYAVEATVADVVVVVVIKFDFSWKVAILLNNGEIMPIMINFGFDYPVCHLI